MLEIGIVLAVARWAEPALLPGFVLLTGMATAAVVLGLNVRTRRAYLAALEDRAAQLERERDQRPGWPPPPSGRGSPARCTTSSPTTSR